LFYNAFGSEEITPQKISFALAQFLRSIVSYRSKWDQGYASQHLNFTQEEKLGKQLFQQKKCSSCHSGVNFRTYYGGSANIGLDLEYTDNGIGDLPTSFLDSISGGQSNSSRKGYFQVPSLRNVALTAPYMHDGRFATLEEVIEHYNSGIKAHPNLDWNLQQQSQGPFFGEDDLIGNDSGNNDTTSNVVKPIRMNLTQEEKNALVAFLKTLSDESIITDPKFSDPFVKR
jgi:cytochrome c peroxidase